MHGCNYNMRLRLNVEQLPLTHYSVMDRRTTRNHSVIKSSASSRDGPVHERAKVNKKLVLSSHPALLWQEVHVQVYTIYIDNCSCCSSTNCGLQLVPITSAVLSDHAPTQRR